MKRLGAAGPGTRGPSQASRVAIGLIVCVALTGAAATVVITRGTSAPGPAWPRSTSIAVVPRLDCCPHTPAGAAEAVGSYLEALGGPVVLNPAAASAVLDQIADPEARAELGNGLAAEQRVEEGLWGVESAVRQGKRVVLTQTPIAYRVTSYSDQVATVAVWLVTTVGVENRQRLTAFFANGSATVAWLDGAWRLHAITNGSAAGDAVPACIQTPTPTGGIPSQLDEFTPYGS